jgi:hypothetical protein
MMKIVGRFRGDSESGILRGPHRGVHGGRRSQKAILGDCPAGDDAGRSKAMLMGSFPTLATYAKKQESRPRGGFRKVLRIQVLELVAGAGFEPAAFRL